MNDLFKSDPTQTEEITLESLKIKFGDGENFDVDKLAMSKLESDKFIKQLQRENEELRGEVSSKVTMDALLTEVRKLKEPGSGHTAVTNPPANEPKNNSEVEQLVSSILEKRNSIATREANERLVTERLENEWGADVRLNLNKKAKELGVRTENLYELAIGNPSVFFAAIGLKEKQVAPASSMPRSTVNTQGTVGGPEVRNKAYYDSIKAKDKTLYFSKKMQNQMMKDAIQLGEKFFE